jgi:transposase
VSRKRNKPVVLSTKDRQTLQALINSGHAPARELTHARILLKADEGKEGEEAPERALPGKVWPDVKIADALEVSRSTVARVRERFAREGLEAALLHRRPKRTKPKKLDGSQEAHLIALACSQPPRGREHWSIRLLADRFVNLECAEGIKEPISRELVRRTLKKVNSSPG